MMLYKVSFMLLQADWLPEMPYPLAAAGMVVLLLVLLGLAVRATIRITRRDQD